MMISFASTQAGERAGNVTLKVVNPAGLYDPVPNGYNHAIVAEGGSRMAFIAGQGGENAKGELSPKFSDQVQQAYANLNTALKAVGAEPEQVVKITTYVVDYDPSMLDVMTRHLKQLFGDALPTQTLVPVPRLALDGMLFEVEALAIMD